MDPGELLVGLDDAQVAAVTTPSRLVAVIAGAGSGKTRVLTRRVAHRVATDTADAAFTLALTFTREAAGELRRRLRRLGLHDGIEAGTFHAIVLKLLRQRWADLDRPPPTVVSDRERLLRDVAGRTPVAPIAVEADWAAARGIDPDDYMAAARAAGRRGAVPPDRVAELLDAYRTVKRRRGVVDLDDVLALGVAELVGDPRYAEAVRWRFRHLLVDEAQDLNPVQHRLLQLLRGDSDDLYLVGDPAQAIYGFNGADPTLLLDVTDRLPGIEIIRLPTNHRCSAPIVAAGRHVLARAQQPIDARSSRPDGVAVSVVGSPDSDHEARVVAEVIRSCDVAIVRTGGVAVLARTHRQLTLLESALTALGVPVRRRLGTRGSPLDAAALVATRLPSATRLRAWAHDVVDEPPSLAPDDRETAERMIAAAVLDFLREHPTGDGATLRTWLATTDPFGEHGALAGPELLTFHAAKGREWHTVVVTGVQTGSVPHGTARTVAARAEEARLLYVAMTRASDRLVVTWVERYGGYARRPSPLIEALPLGESAVVAPPPTLPHHEHTPTDLAVAALQRWRSETARAVGALPEQVCSDHALAAIAASRPATIDDLAATAGFGRLTAAKMFAPIQAALAST